MNPVEVVTIKKLTPIYKEGEVASNIELVNLEETGYEIIAQKGLYEVGDKAVYIQPDYCLPDDVKLFESFTKPGGNPKKSRLGKNNRIRAIKFNFSKKGETDPIYSMGILLPYREVHESIGRPERLEHFDLQDFLKIIKYEEPETGHSGQQKGDLPLGMYKTDEDNFENKISKLKFPCKLVGTKKVDGSSITIYVNDKGESGICSRSHEKKLETFEVVGYESPIGEKIRKHFDRDTQVLGWYNESTGDFFTEVPKDYKQIIKIVRDSWVELGKPVLEKLQKLYKKLNKSISVRGEIVGQGLKGSGNKNNPDKNIPQTLFVYGIDDYSSGVTKKLPMKNVINMCEDLELNMVPVIFNKTFRSEKTLRKACNDYFKKEMIEGIVIRSLEDTSFSAKFMNPEYDSKK